VAQQRQQAHGGVAVLDSGGGDHDRQERTAGVHRNVPLAFVDLLAVMPVPT
jgi:hypothetical protein